MLENINLIILIILIMCFLLMVVWLYFINRSIRFQKRIENHVLSKQPLEDISILDQISNHYYKWRKRQVLKIEKTEIWKQYCLSKKNSFYEDTYCNRLIDRLVLSIICGMIYLFLSIFNHNLFSIWIFLFIVVIGFYLPNFIDFIQKKIVKKQMEKDLLKAVTLMNNAFQSGKSIIQAVQTVSLELDGPLSKEFSKIHQDMLHGLSFEKAFIRFQERVKLEEIEYITASLSILNRTGGNIIEVFSAIENNFYTRRKLEMELKSTIASSRLVFQFLLFLPILLFVFIGFLDPTYFMAFKESTLGILLFMIILSIYLIYIIAIRSIMKIEKY